MHLHQINRRNLLRFGAAGAGLGVLAPQLRGMTSLDTTGNESKGIVLFLRGGNDGINTLRPTWDSSYGEVRPGIQVTGGFDLDMGFGAFLHPSMEELDEQYQDGGVAFIHRTHFDGADFSHFTNQRAYETTDPALTREAGYAPPLLNCIAGDVTFRGASISSGMQRAFISDSPDQLLAHIPSVGLYNLDTSPGADKLKARLPAHFNLDGALGADLLARNAGDLMLASAVAVQDIIPGDGYQPPNGSGAVYPEGEQFRKFREQLKEAIQILKTTSCRFVGVELGGFDNHADQGNEEGRHADLLKAVSQALTALQRDWDASGPLPPLLTLCMSEFGRTNSENSSRGTDHAASSLMIAVGTNVKKGIYNMDEVSWEDGLMGRPEVENTIPLLTDFRAVLAEAFDRHFGVNDVDDLTQIIKDWNTLSTSGIEYFDYVNYLNDLN